MTQNTKDILSRVSKYLNKDPKNHIDNKTYKRWENIEDISDISINESSEDSFQVDDRVKKFMKVPINDTEFKTSKKVSENTTKSKESSDSKALNNKINYEATNINVVKNYKNFENKNHNEFKNPEVLLNSKNSGSLTDETNNILRKNSDLTKLKQYTKIETAENKTGNIEENNGNKISLKLGEVNGVNETSLLVSQTSNESYEINEDDFFQDMINIKDLNEVFDLDEKGNLSSHQDSKIKSNKNTKLTSKNNSESFNEDGFVDVDKKSNFSKLDDNRLSDSPIIKDIKQVPSLDDKNILTDDGDKVVHSSLKDEKEEKKLEPKQNSKRTTKKNISQTTEYEKKFHIPTNRNSERIPSFTVSDINLLANLISDNIKSKIPMVKTSSSKNGVSNDHLNTFQQNEKNQISKTNSYAQTDSISAPNIEKHWILKDDNEFSKHYKPQHFSSFQPTRPQNYRSTFPNQPSLYEDHNIFSQNQYHRYKLADFPTFIEPELLAPTTQVHSLWLLNDIFKNQLGLLADFLTNQKRLHTHALQMDDSYLYEYTKLADVEKIIDGNKRIAKH